MISVLCTFSMLSCNKSQTFTILITRIMSICITDCHQFRLGVMQQYLNHGVAPGTSEHANTQFSFHDIPFLWYEYQRSHSQYRDIYLRLRCFLCRQEPVINVMQKSRSRNAQVPAGQCAQRRQHRRAVIERSCLNAFSRS